MRAAAGTLEGMQAEVMDNMHHAVVPGVGWHVWDTRDGDGDGDGGAVPWKDLVSASQEDTHSREIPPNETGASQHDHLDHMGIGTLDHMGIGTLGALKARRTVADVYHCHHYHYHRYRYHRHCRHVVRSLMRHYGHCKVLLNPSPYPSPSPSPYPHPHPTLTLTPRIAGFTHMDSSHHLHHTDTSHHHTEPSQFGTATGVHTALERELSNLHDGVNDGTAATSGTFAMPSSPVRGSLRPRSRTSSRPNSARSHVPQPQQRPASQARPDTGTESPARGRLRPRSRSVSQPSGSTLGQLTTNAPPARPPPAVAAPGLPRMPQKTHGKAHDVDAGLSQVKSRRQDADAFISRLHAAMEFSRTGPENR